MRPASANWPDGVRRAGHTGLSCFIDIDAHGGEVKRVARDVTRGGGLLSGAERRLEPEGEPAAAANVHAARVGVGEPSGLERPRREARALPTSGAGGVNAGGRRVLQRVNRIVVRVHRAVAVGGGALPDGGPRPRRQCHPGG